MDIATIVRESHTHWKVQVILNALIDSGVFTSLTCTMPGCLLPNLPMRLDNRVPRVPESLTLDHIICRADDGPDILTNLRPVHYRCQTLNPPQNRADSRARGETARYQARAYTSNWVECSCGMKSLWGAGYRRHVGRVPRPDHYPARTFSITRRAGMILDQHDVPMPQLPIGRPGWPTAYWVAEENEWWVSKE